MNTVVPIDRRSQQSCPRLFQRAVDMLACVQHKVYGAAVVDVNHGGSPALYMHHRERQLPLPVDGCEHGPLMLTFVPLSLSLSLY